MNYSLRRKMIDLKPYGGFIEYTIRPLIKELEKFGFKYDEKLFIALIKLHISSKVIDAIVSLASVVFVCYTAYWISR